MVSNADSFFRIPSIHRGAFYIALCVFLALVLTAGCADPSSGQNNDAQAPPAPDSGDRNIPYGDNGQVRPDFADPDMDGIVTATELAMGFDPNDPSSAPAWHPEWSENPRLFFDKTGLDRAIQRARSDRWPYNIAADRLRLLAYSEPPQMPQDVFDPDVMLAQSDIAQAAAFVSFLDQDPSLAQKALGILSGLDSRVERIPLEELDHGTILGGMALVQFCLAYDLLASRDDLDPQALDDAALGVITLADALYYFYVDLFPVMLALTMNNHNIKFAAGIGMAGMTFNQRPEAAVYVNYAQTDIYYIMLDWQSTEDGGWAEGPNYMVYTEETSLPYLAAYHQFANGALYPYRIDCANRYGSCSEDIVWIEDMLLDPKLDEIHRWWLDIALPWHSGPPIDDSNLHSAYPGIWAAFTDEPTYHWLFENRPSMGRLALMHLAYYPEDRTAEPPQRPRLMIRESAGQAVLRTSDDPEALYALIMGEHGKARLHGMGHEQPDATSVILAASGELLLIDSGYIDFNNRGLVADAENHNLILVDGQGPPSGFVGVNCGVDAYLYSDLDTPELSALRVETEYRGVEFTRRLWMIENEYVVVIDTTASALPHEYDLLWHTALGSGDAGSLDLTSGGFDLLKNGVGLTARISSFQSVGLQKHTDYHGFLHGRPQTHEVVSARSYGLSPAWITVLHPYVMDKPDLSFTEIELEDIAGWIVRGRDSIEIFVVKKGDPGFCLAPRTAGLDHHICTTGRIMAAAFHARELQPAWGFSPQAAVYYNGSALDMPD